MDRRENFLTIKKVLKLLIFISHLEKNVEPSTEQLRKFIDINSLWEYFWNGVFPIWQEHGFFQFTMHCMRKWVCFGFSIYLSFDFDWKCHETEILCSLSFKWTIKTPGPQGDTKDKFWGQSLLYLSPTKLAVQSSYYIYKFTISIVSSNWKLSLWGWLLLQIELENDQGYSSFSSISFQGLSTLN